MKKVVYLIITLVLLTIGVLGVLKIYQLKKDNSALSKEIEQLNISKQSLTIEKAKLEEKLNPNTKCSITKTLQYIETINYVGQANERFAVFTQFQTFSPILLRINETFNIEFEKDQYYEIKFEGNSENITNMTIKSIAKTDKIGFDQIQESC